MLLETIKSLVARLKKLKPPTVQTEALPDLLTKSEPTNGPGEPTEPTLSENDGVRLSDAGQSGQPAPAVSTSDFFPNAQSCVVTHSTMIAQLINTGGTVLQLLGQKRIPGAEVDSSARDPPPKCHPDTRKTLRSRILDWFRSPDRHWRMLWIIGPMGVGKSAVAQTIAEELNASGRLGAALFFSRPNNRDDPEGVIPTLAYQLAAKFPEYKRVITQRLADDATILEKNRRTQFKELIIEPFQILMTQRAQVCQNPLLIILDGLDECKGKKAQCEFVELISDHVRQVEQFPLLWMICSRPEWHLKGLLSHPDFQVTCKREEIAIDDAEAQQDVARALGADFQAIRRKYYDRLDVGWPPEGHIRRISTISSGHFAFASTIVKFIDDDYRADPDGRLNICIRFLGSSDIPGAVNPLHALDLLYRRILSDAPDDVLLTTMRILGLSVLYPDPLLTVNIHANFLRLDRGTFYRALQHLHSVVEVPSVMDAHCSRLRFYHASFADYLSDPLRSESFRIVKPSVHSDVAIHSLKWQRGSAAAEDDQDVHSSSHPRLEWVHTEVNENETTSSLRDYSSNVWWEACCHIPDKDFLSVVAELERSGSGDIEEHLKDLPNCGPVLDSFQLRTVGVQLKLNPLLTPVPDGSDRVHLKWNMTTEPSLIYRSTDPHHVSWSTGRNEPATFPRLSEIKIVSEHYPWLIEVSAQDPNIGVTCGEVIEAIASSLVEHTSKSEFDALSLTREGLKRADFLGSMTTFGGVEVDERAVERVCNAVMPDYVVLRCNMNPRRRNAEERAATLRADKFIGEVEPNRVFCLLCQKWVQLRQDSSYTAYPWIQHRSKCERRQYVKSLPVIRPTEINTEVFADVSPGSQESEHKRKAWFTKRKVKDPSGSHQ